MSDTKTETVTVKLESFEMKNTSMFNYAGIIAGMTHDYGIHHKAGNALDAYNVLKQIGGLFPSMPYSWIVMLCAGKYTTETNSETNVTQFKFTQEFDPALLPNH